mmetsp:Transcript_17881/g.53831  ORF Transcript_17881/g.53831 Transcript_17881/m.53831 type:complete len:582 (-) Transcript_17881:1836-3581(-)
MLLTLTLTDCLLEFGSASEYSLNYTAKDAAVLQVEADLNCADSPCLSDCSQYTPLRVQLLGSEGAHTCKKASSTSSTHLQKLLGIGGVTVYCQTVLTFANGAMAPFAAALLSGAVMVAAWHVCCAKSASEAAMVHEGDRRRTANGPWSYDLPGPCGASVHRGIKVAGNTTTPQGLPAPGSAASNLTKPFVVTVTVTLPVSPIRTTPPTAATASAAAGAAAGRSSSTPGRASSTADSEPPSTAASASATSAATTGAATAATTAAATVGAVTGAAVTAASKHTADGAEHVPTMLPEAPYPVVVLIDGFQCRSGWYSDWALRLASWGYAVVQYDDPLLRIVPDAVELQFFPVLLEWLGRHSAASAGFLAGQLDLDHLATAGHSRGGKLAALHFASRPEQVKALFMIDPVDSGPSVGYPSAAAALRQQKRKYGLVGAGRINNCNPEGQNYKQFFGVAPDDSWQATVPAAGHVSFLQAGRPIDWALRKLCPGCMPQAALPLAMPIMVAWLEQELRPSPSQEESEVEFQRWLTQQEAADLLTFTIKGSGGSTGKGVSRGGTTTPITAAATLQSGSAGGISRDKLQAV